MSLRAKQSPTHRPYVIARSEATKQSPTCEGRGLLRPSGVCNDRFVEVGDCFGPCVRTCVRLIVVVVGGGGEKHKKHDLWRKNLTEAGSNLEPSPYIRLERRRNNSSIPAITTDGT